MDELFFSFGRIFWRIDTPLKSHLSKMFYFPYRPFCFYTLTVFLSDTISLNTLKKKFFSLIIFVVSEKNFKGSRYSELFHIIQIRLQLFEEHFGKYSGSAVVKMGLIVKQFGTFFEILFIKHIYVWNIFLLAKFAK
jgi:hypothetical protein